MAIDSTKRSTPSAAPSTSSTRSEPKPTSPQPSEPKKLGTSIKDVFDPKGTTPTDPVKPSTPKPIGGGLGGISIGGGKPREPVVPKTPAEAVEAADAILMGPELEREPRTEGRTGTITRDPGKVNDSRDTNPDSVRYKEAKAQVEANAALEQQELAKLSPEDRAKYESVKKTIQDQNDPVAELALQKMLFSGQIPGEKDMKGGGTTLDNLAKLADENTPLAEGIDRGELVSDVVQELAVPSSIAQGSKGTCAATTVGVELAIQNPAEYVRLMTGLASPEGSVELANGDTIQREADVIADDGSGRSISQRLMEPAFMEYADAKLDYQNAGDGQYDPAGDKKHSGLYARQVDHLMEGVFNNKDYAYSNNIDSQEEKDAAWDEIQTQLEAGNRVPVGMDWGNGGHKVLVTGTETIDGVEYVNYINPWGQEERLPKDEFLDRLNNMHYDPNVGRDEAQDQTNPTSLLQGGHKVAIRG